MLDSFLFGCTMLTSIRKLFKDLRTNISGNATMLVALGLPVMIGGSGLAVDTAQWYMWKRELQFAVDQAALASAWARTTDSTKGNYVARGKQEFKANLSTTASISPDPAISLASYNGGTDNSVVVYATASRVLPFSHMFTKKDATITASAQASVTAGATYTACLIAVDPNDDAGVITINGSVTLKTKCGLAALSTNANSINANGLKKDDIDPGSIFSRGGIDAWFAANGYDVHQYMSSLADPFGAMNTPDTSGLSSKTIQCPQNTTVNVADTETWTEQDDVTYTGTSSPPTTAGTIALSAGKTKGTSAFLYAQTVPDTITIPSGNNKTVEVTTKVSTVSTGTITSKKTGNTTTYTRIDKEMRQHVKYSNFTTKSVPPTSTAANAVAGIYTSFDPACDVVLTGGLYVIDGGMIKLDGSHQISSKTGVMIILKNGAGIQIGGTQQGTYKVNLAAMTIAELEAAGLSAAEAAKFEGMLVWEDRNSAGNKNGNKQPQITGNANIQLDGKIYLPKSNIKFAGNVQVGSRCLLIAAYQITVSGNVDMSGFCPAGQVESDAVATEYSSVKLVA